MTIDRRLHAYREDLADKRLKSKIKAKSYAEAIMGFCGLEVASLRPTPDMGAGIDTELLSFEPLEIFEKGPDFSWVQSLYDGYVGYVKTNAIVEIENTSATQGCQMYYVDVPATFIYPEETIKKPPLTRLSYGTMVITQAYENKNFLKIVDPNGQKIGFVIARHFIEHRIKQYNVIKTARKFLHTPYLWGGKTSIGLDCSALIQLCFKSAGIKLLRDSDMQLNQFDEKYYKARGALAAGDLIYWKGHVALVSSPNDIIHANGHHMQVVEEPLHQAIERIQYEWGSPIAFIENPINH